MQIGSVEMVSPSACLTSAGGEGSGRAAHWGAGPLALLRVEGPRRSRARRGQRVGERQESRGQARQHLRQAEAAPGKLGPGARGSAGVCEPARREGGRAGPDSPAEGRRSLASAGSRSADPRARPDSGRGEPEACMRAGVLQRGPCQCQSLQGRCPHPPPVGSSSLAQCGARFWQAFARVAPPAGSQRGWPVR